MENTKPSRGARSRFFRGVFGRTKRRAPSFDATIVSSGSSSDCMEGSRIVSQQQQQQDGMGDNRNSMSRETAMLNGRGKETSAGRKDATTTQDVAIEEERSTTASVESKKVAQERWRQELRPTSIQIVENDDEEQDPVYQDVALRSRLEALRLQEQLLGAEHPDFLFALQSLGHVHYRRGEYKHAQRVFDEKRRLVAAAMMADRPPREICIHHKHQDFVG